MWQKVINWLKNVEFAKFMCALLTVCSLGLFIWGFFVPPLGVVDGSILKASGILLGFAILWVIAHIVIELDKTARMKYKDVEVIIKEEDKK